MRALQRGSGLVGGSIRKLSIPRARMPVQPDTHHLACTHRLPCCHPHPWSSIQSACPLLLHLLLTPGLLSAPHASMPSGHRVCTNAPWPLLQSALVCPGVSSRRTLSLPTSTPMGRGQEQSCMGLHGLGHYGVLPIKQSAHQMGAISVCDS